MFGIGGFELFIILLFGFLIFGPDKLPEMAKTLGMALRKFQKAREEMESVIKDEVINASGTQTKKATSASSSSSNGSRPAPKTSQESFAERKARFDKERAERKAQEARKAQDAKIAENRQALKEEAARKVREPQVSPVAKPAPSAMANPAASSASKERAQRPALSPEELFGTKPIQRKPSPVSTVESGSVESAQSTVSGRGE